MPERIVYLDCFSGASGDMLLGALLDAGLSLDDLRADLTGLGLMGYDLALTRQIRHGITGSKFDVMEESGSQPVRDLSAVRQIIEGSKLSPSVAASSLQVFERLARAEGSVHGEPPEQVHFHELSAIDSLVDIVGFCCALERLEVEQGYCSPLPLGNGTIMTQHGLLPVPAPATLALLAEAQAPVRPTEAQGELLTPTGAALITTFATFATPAMRIQQVGYGFGSKEFPWANMLRVWIGEKSPEAARIAPHSYAPYEHDQREQHDHDHAHGHEHSHNHDAGHHEHSHSHDHDHTHHHYEEH